MSKNYTPHYLFTVDQDEISILNVFDFLDNFDKELDEILGVQPIFEPKEETVNAILKYCK